MQIVVEARFSS